MGGMEGGLQSFVYGNVSFPHPLRYATRTATHAQGDGLTGNPRHCGEGTIETNSISLKK
jgi:hypothetical protein